MLPRLAALARLTLLLASSSLALAGCAGSRARPAESAEEAYDQLLSACDSGDGAHLFDALDTETQWAIETVFSSQKEMRQLIRESYPTELRDGALARLPASADESGDRARRYFRALPEAAEWGGEIKKRLYAGTGQPVGSVRRKEGIAEVWRTGGSVFHFARDEKGRWGYLELREIWIRNRERALHELETVKQNAALYKQARATTKGAG